MDLAIQIIKFMESLPQEIHLKIIVILYIIIITAEIIFFIYLAFGDKIYYEISWRRRQKLVREELRIKNKIRE